MKRILISTLALLLVVGMSGCSTKTETEKENEKSIEQTGDTSLMDTSHVHFDYQLLEPDDMIKYEKFIASMTTDMQKLVLSNQDKKGEDIKDTDEMKDFAKKYALSANMLFTTEFFNYTKNAYDGADSEDGTLDNKLIVPKQINLYNINEGYMPLYTINYSFNESLGYDINEEQFSKVLKNGNEIDNANQFIFENTSKFKDGLGLYRYEPKDSITFSDENISKEVKDGKQITALSASLWYTFNNEYPVVFDAGGNQDERNHNLNNQGANILEIMILKTNDGFKLVHTKWITNQINYYKYVQNEE